jgi:LmbE family N-acetylglucosaminyl deacetylase
MTLPKLSLSTSEIYVPDGADPGSALARATHLGVGAHPDDLEIIAAHGILECFARSDRWFCGVVVGDGAGSPRDLDYKEMTDAEMKQVRRREQRKAAFVGEYGAQVFLDHPSSAVKDASHDRIARDLEAVLRATSPKVVYTHNLADKHDTHVAVTLRLIAACRALPKDRRPERVIGGEVWRDLDWLCDGDKVVMPVTAREHLQAALLGVFDSQIAGGKRYDLATAGRRRANATFFESHHTDQHGALIWGMDLTPLTGDDAPSPSEYVAEFIQRFRSEVSTRIAKLS